jgi:hypothetical protein
MRGSAKLLRLIVEGKLEHTLPLWLDAIARGDYTEAKRILLTRTELRAQLVKLLEVEKTGVANDADGA